MALNRDYGNVPADPQYGEVKQIEEQEQSAPLPTDENQPNVPSAPPLEAVPPPDEAQPAPGPRPDNIVSVLPPPSTSPSQTRQRPLAANEELAMLILGMPGMGQTARRFASQIVGTYRASQGIPQQTGLKKVKLSPAPQDEE